MRKTKTLKDQVRKHEDNEKLELEEIREDNIEAAKKTKVKNINKHNRKIEHKSFFA
jgi:hypothetical protein